MTEQIKSLVEVLESIKDSYSGTDNINAINISIRSLKAWEEVIEELENEINLYENSKSIMGGNDFDIEYDGAMKGLGKAIDIIKEKLSEVENGTMGM